MHEQLPDGTPVVIRPVTPQDRTELAAGFRELSPQSRYRRFLAATEQLDERTLRYLTELDHHDHDALAAFDPADGHGIGVARYVTGPGDPCLAELAVVVADDWQGRGLGTLLVERVVDRAREEGLRHLSALVLATNASMLDLLERHGWRRLGRPEAGTVELRYDVAPAPGG